MAYITHLIIAQHLRNKHEGNHVLVLILKHLEKALLYMHKSKYVFTVQKYHRAAINLYNRRGGKLLGEQYVFEKTINQTKFPLVNK